MTRRLLSSLHYFFPDLSARWDGPELMDDLNSSQKELFTTLSCFKYVNLLLSRYTAIYKKFLLPELIAQRDHKITILDLGAGGCDIALWLNSQCVKYRLDINFICIDTDPRAVEFGKKVCAPFKNIRVERSDFFDLDLSDMGIDYIVSNHLIHHIDTNRMTELLQRVEKGARKGFIMNDICRSWQAYSLFTIFAGVFFRKGFAFHDGRLSIRKSFTLKEINSVIKNTGLETRIRIRPLIPFRYLLISSNW